LKGERHEPKQPRNYYRLIKPKKGLGRLPNGLVDLEAVPEAVTRKAAKHLNKLPETAAFVVRPPLDLL
jgi:hypothetical protein